jgi:hypothetical protein
MRLSHLDSLPPEWSAHGLTFRQGEGEGADVQVRFQAVPHAIPGPDVQLGPRVDAGPGQWLRRLGRDTRITARSGSEIVVDSPAPAVDPFLEAWVTGPATAAILYQRDLAPLHASAVALPDGAAAFLANSGTGKSSLAAQLVLEGARLVADDMLVVRQTAGGAEAVPGARGIRLGPGGRRRFSPLGQVEPLEWPDHKRIVELPDTIARAPLPLRAMFLLECGDSLALTPLRGAEMLGVLRGLVQRPRLVRPLGVESVVFAQLGQLARTVPAFRLARRRDHWAVPEWARLVRETMDALPPQRDGEASPSA